MIRHILGGFLFTKLKGKQKENLETYSTTGHKPDGDWLTIGRNPQDIHITVAGGPGKHSAFIPSFGGTTVAAVRIAT